MPDYPMNWWEFVARGPFVTSADHRIVVRRESIPIVFVPGIMGSRLKRNGNRIWDPNSKLFMVRTYFSASPSARKALITDEGIEVDVDTSEEFRQQIEEEAMGGSLGMMGIAQMPASMRQQYFDAAQARGKMAVEQGWGGVAWDFYGKLLQALATQSWEPFNKCFVFPVYAVGYNWVQDNRLSGAYLAGQIPRIMARERVQGLICDKTIVVSHSMGGLVSRAAAKLHQSEPQILGIVHGAQPVLGAPAAYRRMRAGFESDWNPLNWMGSHVLGDTSEKVMPVLGNSVGGLELLPTHLYKTNKDQVQWLKMSTREEQPMAVLPKGDPYSSIYEKDSVFLQLAYHPEYLDPTLAKKPVTSAMKQSRTARKAFSNNLDLAQQFHADLGLKCHGLTYSSWVSGMGKPTWDEINYQFLRPRLPVTTLYTNEGAIPYDPNPSEGTGIDYWENAAHPEQDGYYEIQPQAGEGDGTVPVSSGSALAPISRKTKIISGVEHSAFYNQPATQTFVVDCVKEMAKRQFHIRLGDFRVQGGKL